MDNPRLEELLRGNVPATDAAARERARLRLRATIAEEGLRSHPASRRKRRWLLPAAAASLALAVLLVQAILPPGRVGPASGAAAEIRRLGSLAAQQEPLMPGPSDFVYQRMEVQTQQVTHLTTSGSSFALDVHATVESWLATDGSGRVVTTYTSVSFASDQDRAVWEENGKRDIPATGDVVTEPYLKSGLTYFPIDKLPTDPAALRTALNDGSVIEWAPGDLNLLSTIGTLLSQEDMPSDLRHALFEVAATIPTVAVEPDVLDPIGREAIAVSIADDAGTTRLFFDPSDARFLGRSETFVPSDGGPGAIDWRAYLERGVVSDLGERPAS